MIAQLTSIAFQGLAVTPVSVQVQLASGMPGFNIVGLPDKAVAESKERVRAAIHYLGFALPPKRITVNLAPADIAKEGSHFDLAIACGILENLGIIPKQFFQKYLVIGELALDGNLSKISGVLPAALGAVEHNKGLVCPAANGTEARWAGDELEILAPPTLLDLIKFAQGDATIANPMPGVLAASNDNLKNGDLAEVKGQTLAKRALIIAAAGQHNLLMLGAPGSGKSMLASRLPSILPPLSHAEILETSQIASITGQIEDGQLITNRSFRSPHHSCSMAAMVGGGVGRKVKPGEVTMAHRGVLFLDELPEFNRQVLDALRQPIETGVVHISRSGHHVCYPAKFQLVAAMNPCHCGYLMQPDRACSRAPSCSTNYLNKVSGPIYDRFDIKVEVNTPNLEEVLSESTAPDQVISSATAAKLVAKAVTKQYQRNEGQLNSELNGEVFTSGIDDEAKKLLHRYMTTKQASMRSYYRLIKVARTIADLDESNGIRRHHIAESLSFRSEVVG